MKKIALLLLLSLIFLAVACTPDEIQQNPNQNQLEVDPTTVKPPTHG
ncbi:hypothetical protein [Flavobacterium sp.]